jgi:hypothetical protein
MNQKFNKDIEEIKNDRHFRAFDWNKDYTDDFNKDDRIWINTYFITRQLKVIKWILIVIVIILFITLNK